MQRGFILFILFLLALNCLSDAQVAEEEIILYVGQTKTISVNKPTRIVVGKPEIADVVSATENDITLAGKLPGASTFVFWDSMGERDFRVRVFAEEMSDYKRRIDTILSELGLSDVYTKGVDSEGKVLLLGELKTSAERERLITALGDLKTKYVDLIKIKEEEGAIEIDTQLLELDRDAQSTLGFSWPGSTTITEIGSPALQEAGTKFSTLFKVSNLGRDAFSVTLDFLVEEGKARILSRPRLVCQSGKEAELLVGGEKPIMTTQTVGGGGSSTSVEYKEYGIILKIKPTITEDNRVKLGLDMEVSEVGEAEFLGPSDAPTAKAYPLVKRNASTELFLNDGQVLSIGGLSKQKHEEDIRKTPWLGDLPILGIFFRKKVTKSGGGKSQRGETELFITLTPTIIGGKKDTSATDTTTGSKKFIAGFSPLEAQGLAPELQNYVRAIQNRILRAVYYPREAKNAGWEGTLRLSLLLTANGSLQEILVSQSTGYKVLDDAGQDTVKKVSPFPPFPTQSKIKELRIEVPIVFRRD